MRQNNHLDIGKFAACFTQLKVKSSNPRNDLSVKMYLLKMLLNCNVYLQFFKL